MLRGLEGRRVALFVSSDSVAKQRVGSVIRGLEQAGARIDILNAEQDDDAFHGARYAALVLVGDDTSKFSGDPRLAQLVREFLVSEKPLAALGSALTVVLEAGGTAGRTVAASGALKNAVEAAGAKCVDDAIHVDETLITARGTQDIDQVAGEVVREFSNRLEERDVDEMSDQSFPASDPPSMSPLTAGPAPKPESRA